MKTMRLCQHLSTRLPSRKLNRGLYRGGERLMTAGEVEYIVGFTLTDKLNWGSLNGDRAGLQDPDLTILPVVLKDSALREWELKSA